LELVLDFVELSDDVYAIIESALAELEQAA